MASRKLKVETVAVADSIERRELLIRFSRKLTDLEIAGIKNIIEESIR